MNRIDPDNPYQAPQAVIHQSTLSQEMVLVSGWRRLGTYLVDVVCSYVVIIIVVTALVLGLGESGTQLLEGLAGNFLGILVMVVYYIGFELAFSRTPGKFVQGTVVVDENGNKPTAGQIVGRSFARLIPFEPFSCIGDRSRGWHDSMSKTYVVRVS